jgi:hypothetical protein
MGNGLMAMILWEIMKSMEFILKVSHAYIYGHWGNGGAFGILGIRLGGLIRLLHFPHVFHTSKGATRFKDAMILTVWKEHAGRKIPSDRTSADLINFLYL